MMFESKELKKKQLLREVLSLYLVLHVCTMQVAVIGWTPLLLTDAFKAARHICEHYHMQAPELDIVTAEGILLL